MIHQNEACGKCTQTCLLIHGQRDPSPIVSSFFKVMIDKRFSKVLFFPPKFARLVSHLTDQETYLEDSSGQRWQVGICDYKGSLAIRQGWHTFSSEHGLQIGDFLVFHYIQGQHFVVQIYGTSGLEKLSFCSDTHKGKKRARTNFTATSQDEFLAETDIRLSKKGKSTPSVNTVPESEKAGHQPVTTTFASNINTDTGKRQIVSQAEVTSNVLQGDNALPNHVSTNLESQRKSSSVYEDPIVLELLTSKAPLGFLGVGITQTHKNSEPVNNISLLSQKDNNGHPIGPISCASLISAENGSHSVVQSDNKVSDFTSSNNVTREKPNEASQVGKTTRVDKREPKEVAAKARCPTEKPNGKESTITEEAGQPFPAAVNGNNKVIKSEPADPRDASFPSSSPRDGSFPSSFSCLLLMDGRNFLVLPQSWPQVLVRRKKMGRIIIYLQGPDNRSWPAIYHERSGVKVLASRWASFAAVYGLKPGDECVFQLLNLSQRIFSVHKKSQS